jgi:hypothetical protein
VGNTKLPKPATQGTVVGDIARKHQGITFAMVTGLYSAASRSALQPAGCAGWIELLRYSLMPLGDFARRRSPYSHRSSMAMPYLIIHILLQLLFKVNLNILWGYFEDF